jgi:hypothetical protein
MFWLAFRWCFGGSGYKTVIAGVWKSGTTDTPVMHPRLRASIVSTSYILRQNRPIRSYLLKLSISLVTVLPESFDTLRYSGPTEKRAQQHIEGLRANGRRKKMASTDNCEIASKLFSSSMVWLTISVVRRSGFAPDRLAQQFHRAQWFGENNPPHRARDVLLQA